MQLQLAVDAGSWLGRLSHLPYGLSSSSRPDFGRVRAVFQEGKGRSCKAFEV